MISLNDDRANHFGLGDRDSAVVSGRASVLGNEERLNSCRPVLLIWSSASGNHVVGPNSARGLLLLPAKDRPTAHGLIR